MLKTKVLFLVAMLLSRDGGFLLPGCNPQHTLVKVVVREDPNPSPSCWGTAGPPARAPKGAARPNGAHQRCWNPHPGSSSRRSLARA